MHGGGFILGDLDAEDFLCRKLVEQTKTILLSVDYHLAPEHKHPAQLKDTLTMVQWVGATSTLPRDFILTLPGLCECILSGRR